MKKVLLVIVVLLALGGCSDAFTQGFYEGAGVMPPYYSTPSYYPGPTGCNNASAGYDTFGTGTIYGSDGGTSTLYYNEY